MYEAMCMGMAPFFTIGSHSKRVPKVINVNLYTIIFIGHK
jgi:hypothetical protein